MDELIKKAQDGDSKSFSLLYKKYYNDVYYTVFNIVKDSEVANDLVSEVFIKVYQNLSKYRENISFRMWLKTIGNNYSIDYLRKKKRDDVVNVDDFTMSIENSTCDTPLSELIDKEEVRILYESINELKEPYKSIIRMRLDGKKYHEISEELNINLGTLKAYINFAKRKITKFSNHKV